MGVIKTNSHGNQMAVSAPRSASVFTLPPFSYPGSLLAGAESGRYFPPFGIALKNFVVSMGESGLSPTYLVFKMKNPLDADGFVIFQTVGVGAGRKYVSGTFNSDIILTPNDWISVLIFSNGGHKNAVVTFTATFSGNGFNELVE